MLISVGPVVEEAVSLLRATLPSGVELVKNIASDVPNILADATRIHQVIFNLCTNAWHALDDHPGRIEIALEVIAMDDSTPDSGA
jgi:nitrogen-specific signal transduction histidine kinase